VERPATNGSVPALPAGTPEEVQLLDRAWLNDQRAQGARLTLLAPQGGEFLQPEEFEAGARRLKTEKSASGALTAAVAELKQSLLDHQEKLRVALGAFVAAQSDADRLKERQLELQHELSSCRARLQRQERYGPEAAPEAESMRAEVSSLQAEVRELQGRNRQLDDEVAAARSRPAPSEGAEPAQADQEAKVRALQGALATAQLEVTQLQWALQQADRPAWKKLRLR
jgi:chromosome segregation ATPase